MVLRALVNRFRSERANKREWIAQAAVVASRVTVTTQPALCLSPIHASLCFAIATSHLQIIGEGTARAEVKLATRVLTASESCNDVGRARMYSCDECPVRSGAAFVGERLRWVRPVASVYSGSRMITPARKVPVVWLPVE